MADYLLYAVVTTLFLCGIPSVSSSGINTNKLNHHMARSDSRSMVYFIKRGIEIKKPDLNFYQRVKRSVVGEDENDPVIQSLFVISNITSRFGTIVAESVLQNPFDDDKEATFRVQLPQNAFMSNFTMLIDGELYISEVKSKEDAEKEYKEAQEQNKTAGMVSNENWEREEQVRGMDNFKVSVNIAAKSSIRFTLTYMELLERINGRYEQRISVRPDQIVEDLEIIVLIFEAQGIADVDVTEPDSNSIEPQYTDVVYMPNDVVAEVKYQPTADEQKMIKKADNKGVKGELTVSYDLVHGDDAGLVQVEGNYFVHYFSPSDKNLDPLAKNIVFVIDISGSMSGDKIAQTRESMLVILDQLRPDDKFLILLFDDDQEYWPSRNTQLTQATEANVISAKGYVRENVKVDGGTNINDALVKAAKFLRSSEQSGANMILFLTDGDPTVGVTNTEAILKNVDAATQNQITIFSLGFGFNMNFDLLRAISFRNGGFARRIYDGLDADTQLQDFYNEINTPLLYNVAIDYGNFQGLDLTQKTFPLFRKGSELIVVGKFLEDTRPDEFDVRIEAKSTAPEPWTMDKHVICDLSLVIPDAAKPIFRPGNFEKLYVYKKIKEQLEKVLMTDDEDEKESLERFALEMALEYHLVTPLTSFIIVQKDDVQQLEEERAYDMGGATFSTAASSPKWFSAGPKFQALNIFVMLVLILGFQSLI